MLDFGDELTVETFKIPWLIWIQILILLLLMVLLYCFSHFSLDLPAEGNNNKSNNNSLASASSGSSSISNQSSFDNKPVLKLSSTVTHRLQPSQAGEIQSIKGEIATSTGRRIVRGEDNTDRDSSNIYYHPCYYFRLAREAFLKCLGLDFASENSLYPERKKDR